MPKSTAGKLPIKKGGKLSQYAKIANNLAWIALIIEILYIGARFFMLQDTWTTQMMFAGVEVGNKPDFIKMLGENALYTISLIVDLAGIFIRGIVFWLILKGISLGLYMIEETKLNYVDKIQGG